jgi:hypothetical protein
MANLFDGNLLEPLTFDEGEIDLFVRDNKCGLCGSHLFAKHAPDRKYTAHCPEHSAVTEHSHTSGYKADQANQSVIDGRHELRELDEPRDSDTILKELGY